MIKCVSSVLSRVEVHEGRGRLQECCLRLKAAAGTDMPIFGLAKVECESPSGLAGFVKEVGELVLLSSPIFERLSVGPVRMKPRWSVETAVLFPQFDLASSEDHVFAFALPSQIDSPTSDAAYVTAWLQHAMDILEFVDRNNDVLTMRVFDGQRMQPVVSWGSLIGSLDAPELGSRAEVRAPASSRRLQPLHSIAATEPRILFIARHWSLIAASMEIFDELGPINLLGFLLNDNNHWVVSSHGHPSDVYEYLARVCNVSCQFCYLYGNPGGLAIARGAKVAARSELDTRLKYYDPSANRALFKAQWEINEFLVDPSLGHVLRSLRKVTQSPFFFVTNGNPLDEKTVDLLAEHKPVDLIVSLNTADAALRQKLMNERSGQTAKAGRSLEMLRRTEIPFGVSIAAFPEVTRDDFNAVVATAESADAAFVRVNLPGYTDQLPPNPPFDSNARWVEVIEWVQAARQQFDIPIISIPSAFEANFRSPPRCGAELWGTIKHSPAAAAGLQAGDIITRLGQFEISSRSELTSLGLLLSTPIEIEFVRDRRVLTTTISPTPARYPYLRPVFGKYLFPHGLVAAPSLSRLDAAELGRILDAADCKYPAIISSPLMVEEAKRLVNEHLPTWSSHLQWIVASNGYLGGNIRVLDMGTVGDLIRAFDKYHGGLAGCDLLVVPSSGFNSQGRDIVGRHWSDLSERIGVPVVPIRCQQFLF